MERHALLPKTWDVMSHYNISTFVASVESLIARNIDPSTLLTALHESMSKCGMDGLHHHTGIYRPKAHATQYWHVLRKIYF